MSAFGMTCRRTVGFARNLCSTALAVSGFLAVSAALFVFSLDPSEGSRLSPAVLWAQSVAPVLPLFCALIAMDSWSEERRTGRIDMLLTLPVRERDLVFGKFAGVLMIALVAAVLSLVVDFGSLWFFAPDSLAGTGLTSVLPAFAAIALQSALYCSVALAVSACFVNAVASATVTVTLIWALPRGVWQALVSWYPEGSEAFGEFPLEAHVADLAGGVVSVAVILFYLLGTMAALTVATKAVFALRFVGRGSASRRYSSFAVSILAIAVAVVTVVFVSRLDMNIDLPLGDGQVRFSQRTRGILSESRGTISAICFVPRSDRRFRSVAHLLRALARESSAMGGARLEVRYVDPHWDVGEAGRLTRAGIQSPAIVFASSRRRVALPLAEGWGERSCASAMLRLTVPPSRNAVYWTFGHGESSFADYSPSGMSDIARELAREGYRNFTLDLTSESKIPADCALIGVAGARQDFSRAETARLDAYLRQGGRLLVLAEGQESALLTTLLPAWGAIAKGSVAKPQRTLSGSDCVISDFGDHSVSVPLKGSQIVLERPVVFAPSAAAGVSTGADRIEFVPLATVESQPAALILERGVGAGSDTAIRPTRIAVIGDAAFVRNAQLASRANANRDFFLNCVSYLSGSHALTSGGADGELFVTGLDRHERMRLLNVSAIAIPLTIGLVLLLNVWRRRSRK